MLGKRFRRTTSMSHLGPAAVAPERKQVSLPDAHRITDPITVDHNIPNQIWQQQPQILTGHEESTTFVTNNSSYGDPNRGNPNNPGLPRGHANNNNVCVVEGSSPNTQTHHLSPVSPLVNYNQVGLWSRANAAGASSFAAAAAPAPSSAGKQQIVSPPVDFLQVCFFCKRRLGLESDIFIYRGDTAFCSDECRHRLIMRDERKPSSRKKSSTSETIVAA